VYCGLVRERVQHRRCLLHAVRRFLSSTVALRSVCSQKPAVSTAQQQQRSLSLHKLLLLTLTTHYAHTRCTSGGTCFVEVKQGAQLLSPPDSLERMVMRSLPARWRLSCRTVVGGNNEPGSVVLRSIPQSAYVAEKRRNTSGS
jgi:ferredoxin